MLEVVISKYVWGFYALYRRFENFTRYMAQIKVADIYMSYLSPSSASKDLCAQKQKHS